MRMTEETIPMKMLHTIMEGKRPTGKPITRRKRQIRKDTEMRGRNEKKKKLTENGKF